MEELLNYRLDWDLLRTMTSLAFSFISTEKLFCFVMTYVSFKREDVVLAGLVWMVAWGTRGLGRKPRRLSRDSVKLKEHRDLCRINTIINTTTGECKHKKRNLSRRYLISTVVHIMHDTLVKHPPKSNCRI